MPVLTPEGAKELFVAGLDVGPPGGEVLDELHRYPGDLPDRLPGPGGVRPLDERHRKTPAQLGFEGGVVELADRHCDPAQRAGVQAAPLAVHALNLGGDGDVGVQIGVAGAAVVMIEYRRDQPASLDLRHPALACPGERGVLLEHLHGGIPGGLVRLPYGLAYLRSGVECPQQRRGFHRGEHHVEPRYRRPRPPGLLGMHPLHLGCGQCPAGFLFDDFQALVDAFVEALDRFVLGKGGTQAGRTKRLGLHGGDLPLGHARPHVLGQIVADHGIGVGVQAHPEQRPHLVLGDLLTLEPEQRCAAALPPTRQVALGGVVIGGVLAALALYIPAGDLPGQVGVAVPGSQLVDRHHRDHLAELDHQRLPRRVGRRRTEDRVGRCSREWGNPPCGCRARSPGRPGEPPDRTADDDGVQLLQEVLRGDRGAVITVDEDVLGRLGGSGDCTFVDAHPARSMIVFWRCKRCLGGLLAGGEERE